MRGIALYDRVMSGQFVADPEATGNGLVETKKDGRDDLERWFDEASRMPEAGRSSTGVVNTTGTPTP